MSRSKFWCFTVNNPWEGGVREGFGLEASDAEKAQFFSLEGIEGATYLTYQMERGEDGTPHLQGYVEFGSRLRLTTAKRKFPAGLIRQNVHLERRRGTAQEAADYTKKLDSQVFLHRVEEGEISQPQRGRRTDLLSVKRAIDEGKSDLEIWDDDDRFGSMVRYHKGFARYKALKMSRRNWQMEILILHGPPGTGKTRYAYDTYPDLYSVPPPKQSGTYWDGYDGQETVLIDEMYGNRFSWGFLLQLLDRYPFQVPISGGQVNFVSRRIIMTSNAHPALWYKSPDLPWLLSKNPLVRRITSVIAYPLDNPPPLPLEVRSRMLGDNNALAAVSDAALIEYTQNN